MKRRNFLRRAGAGGAAVLLAGCAAEQTDDGGTPTAEPDGAGADGTPTESTESTTTGEADDEPATLRVATYEAFLDAPSTSPGEWVKETFESEFDATLEWQAPDNGVNHFVERANANVDPEADCFVGLNVDDLIRVDENVDGGLFAEAGGVGDDDVKEGLRFDPRGRAVPFDTGYISIVYDENETSAPETFDGLLEEEHRGELIAQNPGASATGEAFLLHTIHAYGADGYLDYWADLQENDVRVLGSWSDAYAAYSGGEAPMVVSYSTDQVYADMEGADMSEHQIRFLNDQGYANPEGMAAFEDAAAPELAREFMSFLLRPDVQGEIAQRNVSFPATETAELPDGYAELAHEPPEPVTFTYEELQGNLSDWVRDWERQFAEN